MAKVITARRARRLRQIIEVDRCEFRPGSLHKWVIAYTGELRDIEVWECEKCGFTQW